MRTFTDRHHEGLYSSLVYLFSDRLKGEIFYPLGLPWYEEGYWSVYPSIETAKQYLSLDQLYRPIDGTPPLNQIIEQEDGIYLVQNIDTGKPIKGISFDRFKQTKFDILIASLPQHIEPFKKLIALYQPQAKLILQVGNVWPIDSYDVLNVMASAKIPNHAPIPNFIEYHQEFSTETYHFALPKKTRKIYSFINCLNVVDIYKKDWELFLALEKLLPEFEFKSFGGQCRDSAIRGDAAVAEKTREADFIFHVKNQGDGYSYGMFTAASCGRPMITRLADYRGKLAEPLIEDGISAITVDNRTPEQIAELIRTSYDRIDTMSTALHDKFTAAVDFDAEQQSIEQFLAKLI